MPTPVQPKKSNISSSPISHISGNVCTAVQTTPDTAITPTSLFSYSLSPHTSASSSASFRPSHRALPPLQIPGSTGDMAIETRGAKRKYQDVSPNHSPEPASKPCLVSKQDASVQVGSARDDSMLEMFNIKWRDYHQEMVHIKEEMLENEAKLESQREDAEKWRKLLLQSEKENVQLREKLQKLETVLEEYGISKEKWPL